MVLINLQATVRFIPLHNSTHTLLTCQSHKIRLISTYLPGILNVLADRLSRPNKVFSTESINLANLTVKTVFLTVLASGRRRGELHAFFYKGSGMTDSRKAFIFKFDRSFLAKTQRIHHRVQTALNIPALPYDEQEERYLCPIRYLASSLDRTKEIRKKGTLI